VALSSVPFYGWLMSLEAIAIEHAVACATVAEAWGMTTTGIIPLPVVNENRVSEATAEATNAFGQNTPLIAELNREYAQFWTEDATSMLNYDNAVVLATAPKMVPPPPPLTNLGMASQGLMSQASRVAQAGSQAASRMSSATDGLSQATQGGGSQMMSQMMGPMQSVMQSATQAPQQLMKPLQSLSQPLQSMLGQFMKGPQMGGGLGSAFSATSMGSTGGLPMSTSSGFGGGGMGMGGGGGGIGNLGHLAGSSEKVARPIGNLSGVPAPTLGGGGQVSAANSAMTGGGGGGMGGAGGAGSQSQQRKSEDILAAETGHAFYEVVNVDAEKKRFA
jgi:PPE-repeat protein